MGPPELGRPHQVVSHGTAHARGLVQVSSPQHGYMHVLLEACDVVFGRLSDDEDDADEDCGHQLRVPYKLGRSNSTPPSAHSDPAPTENRRACQRNSRYTPSHSTNRTRSMDRSPAGTSSDRDSLPALPPFLPTGLEDGHDAHAGAAHRLTVHCERPGRHTIYHLVSRQAHEEARCFRGRSMQSSQLCHRGP